MLILKMRLRQEWHIRWVQGNFADLEVGMESSPQVRQETSFSGSGWVGVKREVKIEDGRGGFAGFVVLVVLSGPAGLCAAALGSVALLSERWVEVVLLRTVGRVVALTEARRTAGAGSVLRRSSFGFSAVGSDVLVFLFSLPPFAVCLACRSCSFWKSRRSTMEDLLVL